MLGDDEAVLYRRFGLQGPFINRIGREKTDDIAQAAEVLRSAETNY